MCHHAGGRVAGHFTSWRADPWIRDDLPGGYYRQLPKLAEGPLEGYPRVFGLAWAFVAHTDSRFDPQTLCRFVRAYQRVQPLTIGELWAVAITLRIVLVENIRRSADRIVGSRVARQEADALADQLLGDGEREEELAERALRYFDERSLPREFAVQLIRRLRDTDPTVTPALQWLDERLAAQGTTADELVREEHQRQGAMNVTVRNVITSMRLVSASIERVLRASVSPMTCSRRETFADMDFPTRDRYRHAIEDQREAPGTPSSKSPGGRSWPPGEASRGAAASRSIAAGRIPAITSSRRGARSSRGSLDFALRSVTGSSVPPRSRACRAIWERSRPSAH
jgi:cyclic beta-1,2-glucan synthetase